MADADRVRLVHASGVTVVVDPATAATLGPDYQPEGATPTRKTKTPPKASQQNDDAAPAAE